MTADCGGISSVPAATGLAGVIPAGRAGARALFDRIMPPLIALLLATSPLAASESLDDTDVEDVSVAAVETTENAAKRRKLEHEQELQNLTRDIGLTAERQAELQREIDAIDRDRDTLNADLLRTAQRVHGLESELDATEERLIRLGENVVGVRASLNERRGVLAEVLATLQRIGRRPPPALAVRPQDALSAVRSAMLLNAIMPEVRTEAEALAADLQQLTSLHDEIADERDRLQNDALRLAEERSRVELLIAAKRQQMNTSRGKLAAETKRAHELAAVSSSLKELIGKLADEIDATRLAAIKAAEAEARARTAPGTNSLSRPACASPTSERSGTHSWCPTGGVASHQWADLSSTRLKSVRSPTCRAASSCITV